MHQDALTFWKNYLFILIKTYLSGKPVWSGFREDGQSG